MAGQIPSGAVKMSEAAVAILTGKAKIVLGVANVSAVTERGTKAVCGCCREFAIDPMTSFKQVDGESYACCSKACHEMASEDPNATAKATRDKLAGR